MRFHLAAHRRRAESLMVDAAEIRRPVEPITDPATGEVLTGAVIVYSGKARWKPPVTATATEVGTAVMITSPSEVHIPVGTYAPQPGDVIICTACKHDPGMIGRTATVRSRFGGSQITAYRIPVEDQ